MHPEIEKIQRDVEGQSAFCRTLKDAIGQVIVGQNHLIDRLLIALLADGHILLEGVPGLAKTLSVRTLADAIRADFRRLQFTPDLLPADLLGTMVYHPNTGEFSARKGPIFANIILADEINRAPAKVQSALLEAMQERQVTISSSSYPLPSPFLVLATQNPIEQEGTYPLPEAQVDRFMLKVIVGYPSRDEERAIMDRMTGEQLPKVRPVVTPEEIIAARAVVRRIYIDDKVKDYIVNIVHASRKPEAYGLDLTGLIAYGASPRASIYLNLAARAHAFVSGRAFVTPEDIKSVGPDVLRHRVIVTYEAEAEQVTSATVVQRLFDHVEVP
ncbi:MAG TPA: MoxR family ATPase [candidate division Zixibacteria bacterium]|jgi:MoxR-like ATPase